MTRSTRRTLGAPILALAVLVTATASCSSDGFGGVRNPPRLVVELDPATNRGSPEAPLELKVGTPVPFKIRVHALATDNAIDTSFNRYVRISAKPGAVASFRGPDVDGRNLLLKNGESISIDVSLTNAYGPTYIVAEDLGYVPADPLRQPPPACSNGIDDNGNGLIDFPADPGCAFANDDSEDGGSYAEGASSPIFFRLPRIADIRGLQCANGVGCSGNGKTPYPREQILIDTGWHDDNSFRFSTVITRVAANGYYATDLGDTRGGFNSVFAFNFNAPPRMRVCDRLKTYGGTAGEFFGFTQISYPTWTLEEWDPAKRSCLVPEPERLVPNTIGDATELLKRSANLVRIETTPDKSQIARVTPKFGPGDMPCRAGAVIAIMPDKANCTKDPATGSLSFVPGGALVDSGKACMVGSECKSGVCTASTCVGVPQFPDATNCDFDHNGKINSFNAGDPEGDCSTACTKDPECTEYSNYATRGTFRMTVSDSNGRAAAIQADASTAAGFDAVALKGKPIRSLTGTMSFFSGGAQFTIEVRCADDIVLDLAGSPFLSDKPCTKNEECTTALGLPPAFECRVLGDPTAGKACRKVTPPKNDGDPPSFEPPPQACVFPRTFLENNPQ